MLGADNPNKLIIATYLETGDIQDTAIKLNYSFSWTYRILNKFGVLASKPKDVKKICKTLTSRESSSLISDYINGAPTSLILSKYNISSTTLYFILNQNKIVRRKDKKGFSWGRLSKHEQAFISANVICLAHKNKTLGEIAKELDLPISRVRLILNTMTNKGVTK